MNSYLTANFIKQAIGVFLLGCLMLLFGIQPVHAQAEQGQHVHHEADCAQECGEEPSENACFEHCLRQALEYEHSVAVVPATPDVPLADIDTEYFFLLDRTGEGIHPLPRSDDRQLAEKIILTTQKRE